MKNLFITILISALISIPSFSQRDYENTTFNFDSTNGLAVFSLKSNVNTNITWIKDPIIAKEEFAKQKKHHVSIRRTRGNNPRSSRPIGVNLIYGGPVYFGASANYFIKPDINLKAGGGTSGAFVGMEYHIVGFRNNPWTPFAGIFGTYSYSGYIGLYFPVGFQYIHMKGFSFGFELAFWMRDYIQESGEAKNFNFEYLGSGCIRLGYSF